MLQVASQRRKEDEMDLRITVRLTLWGWAPVGNVRLSNLPTYLSEKSVESCEWPVVISWLVQHRFSGHHPLPWGLSAATTSGTAAAICSLRRDWMVGYSTSAHDQFLGRSAG